MKWDRTDFAICLFLLSVSSRRLRFGQSGKRGKKHFAARLIQQWPAVSRFHGHQSSSWTSFLFVGGLIATHTHTHTHTHHSSSEREMSAILRSRVARQVLSGARGYASVPEVMVGSKTCLKMLSDG